MKLSNVVLEIEIGEIDLPGFAVPGFLPPGDGEKTVDYAPSDDLPPMPDADFVSQGVAQGFRPLRKLVDFVQLRREIREHLEAAGFDGEAVVGALGDGKIIDLITKYGPTAYALARAIAALFGIVLPPIPQPK